MKTIVLLQNCQCTSVKGPVGSNGLICPDAHGPCVPSPTQETVPAIMSKI